MELKKVMDDLPIQEAQDEPKVIAEFHIHQVSATEQFLHEYNHCCLCGSSLEFSHVAHFVDGVVNEEAHCPSCGIRTKTEQHILQ